MKTQEVKKKFQKAFEDKGHIYYPSSSVIPYNDPTLLFVNAGMNQFKEYFLGEKPAPTKKIITAQKCIRVGGKHNDLDNVGHTSRHLTFFEMLGNFSFGDYFKKEAIAMAFNVTCETLHVDPKKIFVSVYEKDLESFELWKQFLPENQICFMGKKDNFWSMGDTGPCGPCSELYFDRGISFGDYKSPKEDPEGKRFIEFWNLVFMEFNASKDAGVSKLPSPCIDTGLGLERMAALLAGKESVFETNIFVSIIDAISSLTNISYASNKAPFHVISDHLRALSFAIADGAVPSNVERGYVLRKILRRAVRYGRQININKPFLADLFPVLLKEMGDDYEELKEAKSRIEELLTIEEESFQKTLSRGGNILNTIIQSSKSSKLNEISGKDAFTLKDTYGFPIEEICLLAKDHHLEVNLDAFSLLEAEAKEKSKKAHITHNQEFKSQLFVEFIQKKGQTIFLRDQLIHPSSTITGLFYNGEFVNSIEKGTRCSIILDQTPFYAEMGGQRGDLGFLTHHKAQFIVENCSSPYPGITIHEGVLKDGILLVGEPVEAKVESYTRSHTEKNHTATHMLHYALEKVLGPHIAQAGSSVSEKGLRLDFSHHKKLEDSEIEEIETMINDAIFKGYNITIKEMSYEDVKNQKQIKQLFGEKYKDTVRVVSVGDFSKELCGGTHVKNTSEIGLFRIIKETSIASGVRRIEALTSKEALAYTYKKEDLLKQVCGAFETSEIKVLESITKLLDEYKEIKSSYKKLQKEQISALLDHILLEKQKIKEHFYIIKEVSMDSDEFAIFSSELLVKLQNGLIILINHHKGSYQLLIQKTKAATSLPSSKILLDAMLKFLNGKGGGSELSARGSFNDPENISKAFSHVFTLLS